MATLGGGGIWRARTPGSARQRTASPSNARRDLIGARGSYRYRTAASEREGDPGRGLEEGGVEAHRVQARRDLGDELVLHRRQRARPLRLAPLQRLPLEPEVPAVGDEL